MAASSSSLDTDTVIMDNHPLIQEGQEKTSTAAADQIISGRSPKDQNRGLCDQTIVVAHKKNMLEQLRRSIMEEMKTDLEPEMGSELELALQGYHNAAADAKTAPVKVRAKLNRIETVFGPKGFNSSRSVDSDEEDQVDSGEVVHPNVIGKFITDKHKHYAMTYAMMLGIRNSISSFAMDSDDASLDGLTRDDYRRVDKRYFPPEGAFKGHVATPAHKLPHAFIFKDYSPKVFRCIRRKYGIREEDYMLSLCGNCNFIEFMTNSKSGEFFYYTGDTKYLIKTMSKEESKFMRVILPDYYSYLTVNPDTFINPFFGMHRVQMHSFGQHVYFMVLGSVFDTELLLHQTYDLKGSKHGREISEEDKEKGKVRKDNNLERDGVKLHLGTNRNAFLAQIHNDSDFCCRTNIMDYSLLVGIHEEFYEKTGREDPGRRFSSMTQVSIQRKSSNMQNECLNITMNELNEEDSENEDDSPSPSILEIPKQRTPTFKAEQGGLRARDEDGHELAEIYFVGVIDILQTYTAAKRMETFIKGLTNKTSDISCVPPRAYASRFEEFMRRNTD